MLSSPIVFVFRILVSLVDGVSLSFFLQAEDGIRYLVRSRGLGDVYKRQTHNLKRCLALGGVGTTSDSSAH